MNREIKFRGKNCIGKWRYGNLEIKREITDEKTYESIRISGINTSNYTSGIIPETVGQFTGLYDKNGKEIYEGDIIDFIYSPTCLNKRFIGFVGFTEYKHSCVIVPNIPSEFRTNEFHIENAMNGEIIGNVYDNPELINAKD